VVSVEFAQASAEFLSLSALAYGLGCAVQASAVAALGLLLGYLKAPSARAKPWAKLWENIEKLWKNVGNGRKPWETLGKLWN